MKIVILAPAHDIIEKVAELLSRSFLHAWTSFDDTKDEVMQSLKPGRISLVALGDDDEVLGWIGGMPQYGGNVWELHPLAVDESHRCRGIGKALVLALEQEAALRGGITMMLGTDDEDGFTSLGNTDIFDNTYGKIESITNLNRHPFEFYQKLGYKIVGVIPDANGWGKPDILMAKRIKKISQ